MSTIATTKFDVSSNDDRGILRAALHCSADSVHLLTNFQRRDGTSKGIEYDTINSGEIFYRIAEKRHRIHGEMVDVFLWLIVPPNCSLGSSCIPFVFTGFKPSVKYRFMTCWYGDLPMTNELFSPIHTPFK